MSDQQAIADVIAAYAASWAAGDFEAWSRLFTAECDFVSWAGLWWKSQAENRAGHEAMPDFVRTQLPFYRLDIAKLAFLGPDCAILHAIWDWPAFIASPDAAPEDRRGILTMVMTKRGGQWLIRASHNSRLP